MLCKHTVCILSINKSWQEHIKKSIIIKLTISLLPVSVDAGSFSYKPLLK